MITDRIIELKSEIEASCGKIVRITLDKKAHRTLRNELTACESMVLGIIIDVVRECPTCGKLIEKEI